MNTVPLTTEQAKELYTCKECKAGNDCGMSCLESATCSVRCNICSQRIWFQGDLWHTPRTFKCPYCDSDYTNKWSMQKL